jgi:hypothetical protein
LENLKQQKAAKLKLEDPSLVEDLQRLKLTQLDPEEVVDSNFKHFSLRELRDHQEAIEQTFHLLNFETAQLMNEELNPYQLIQSQKRKLRQTLRSSSHFLQGGTSSELPSYKEQMAFISALKTRWRQQTGHCSMFQKSKPSKSPKQNQLSLLQKAKLLFQIQQTSSDRIQGECTVEEAQTQASPQTKVSCQLLATAEVSP